jgi:hypothetical protein
MADIKTFITEARTKGLSDEQIRQALTAQGWDASVVEVGLNGLEVPVADNASESVSKQVPSPDQRPSLHPLMAALHHVLLWFFTASSTVTIASVVASLAGVTISPTALSTMIAITVITFTPYAIFFILYLVQSRRKPGLIPGKVWSIITICLHSIGAMIAAITLVVSLINSGEWTVMLSALLILGLDLLVVLAYSFAAFTPMKLALPRKIVTLSYLPLLFILFGILFIMSVLQLGPARHDEQVRKDLTATAQKVVTYARDKNELPKNGSDVIVGKDIRYTYKTKTTYELCGTFEVSSKKSSPYTTYGSSRQISDDYVYETEFEATTPGEQCFTLTSSSLDTTQNDLYY